MWQLTAGQSLRLFQFDEESVLFNDLTGASHLLGGSAIALLALLQGGPASAGAIGARLADELECAPTAAFEEQVEDLLFQLSALFLIEQRPC